MTDRSTESLLARRALAEKATPGPWEKDGIGNIFRLPTAPKEAYQAVVMVANRWDEYHPTEANAAHIAANDPSTVMADIDEILRLREEVKKLQKDLNYANKTASEQHEVAKKEVGERKCG